MSIATRHVLLVALLAAALGCGNDGGEGETLMTAADALALPRPPADAVIFYGPDELNFGELRLPEGEGPHPVAMVIHGGCWLAEYDLGYISGLAAALAANGIASWSVEYRRVGDEGGGWPGTFADVAAAADHLEELSFEHRLDLERSIVVGHSAGGHLALWLAGRKRLEGGDPLRGESPFAFAGVVSLAGIADLASYASPDGCGSAVAGLLDGQPLEVGERLRKASPIEMLPLGSELVMVAGARDAIVPTHQASEFAGAARRKGNQATVRIVDGAGHFELVDPTHPAGALVVDTARTLAFRTP
jgi:acetyl esterase/lipase